jgi:PIN domain nuclease of toxin-antitoxin system
VDDDLLIADPNNEAFFSSISVWEVGIKHTKGHLKIPPVLLRRSVLEQGFSSLPLAFAEPMHFLTHDGLLGQYGGTVVVV